MPFFNANGVKLHYEKTGSGEKAIIFIHGNFASWRWWAPQFSSLPAGYSAYAPDLRGCGDSEHPKTGYDIDTLIDDLSQLVTEIGVAKFHLVGHSLGGALAQEFCYRFPEKIISLTLVAPAPASGLAKLKDKKTASLLSHYLAPERVFIALSVLKAHKPLLRLGFQKSMPGSEYWSEFEALVETAGKMSPYAFNGFLTLLKSWHNPAPEKTTCPVLLIHGKLDPVVPPEELIPMEKQLPNCQRICWTSVGHAPQLEQPDTFSSLLFRFIHTTEEPALESRLIPPPEQTGKTAATTAKSTAQKAIQWLKKWFNRN